MCSRLRTPVEAHDGDAKFRLMFERSADAILMLDTSTNLFVEYNRATLDMLRCTREELSAMHPSVLSPALQADGRDSFEKANEMIAIAMRDGSHRFEWLHCSPHRDDFPVEVLLTPLPLADRSMIVVVWRDITERKRTEEALGQAQKLESVGVLAGGIAHDFNNLLTAMTGHLSLARRGASGATATHLDMIEQAVLKAADLTRQMLAYSGKGRFLIEPVEIGRVVTEVSDLLRISVPPDVRLACELADDVPLVDADRTQVQQIVMNLITNAGEAICDAQGTIIVRVGKVDLDEQTVRTELAGQNLRPGPAVLLEVEDSGRGMPAEIQARIFDPFFSTKESGRGLGLSALRGILKAHGAGIRIRSQVGAGTTFQIFFPASTAIRTAPVLSPRSLARRGQGAVLVVDDTQLVRTSLRGLIEHLGFEVLEASNGLEAIDVFRRHQQQISWVLMDLTMPGMDGHATFLQLRDIDPNIIVILSSGWAKTNVAARVASCPPAAFLAKPFSPEELETTLDRLGLTVADRTPTT